MAGKRRRSNSRADDGAAGEHEDEDAAAPVGPTASVSEVQQQDFQPNPSQHNSSPTHLMHRPYLVFFETTALVLPDFNVEIISARVITLLRAMVSPFDICERRIELLDSLSDLLALVQQCLVTRAARGGY